MNGVGQGGVLSPLLFNVYFDEMIYKLEKRCIGCKIGTHFIGALTYADDVILHYALSQQVLASENDKYM